MKIYKYPLGYGLTGVAMPASGSTPVSAGLDGNGKLCVWVLHEEPDVEKSLRRYLVVGTGEDFSFEGKDLRFVGTAITPTGFVWHVFEEQAQ